MSEKEQRMLRAAGKMADVAGAIVGTSLNSKRHDWIPLERLHVHLVQLQQAVTEYNQAVMEAHHERTDCP